MSDRPRILLLGGYGAFGAHAAERLARGGDVDVVVAGRSAEKAGAFARDLASRYATPVEPAVLDASTLTPHDLRALAPAVVINASGPYQAQDYRVAKAAIACGAHYIDLSDAGAFTLGIRALDAEARRAGVLVASGASSVPALSSAVADHFAPRFSTLESIMTVISPGNSFDPGLATARSILGTIGRPIPGFRDGHPWARIGWQGLARHQMPGLGTRWIGDCDAPDVAVFPARYAGVREVRVCAALEVGAFHLGLWALSGLVRSRMLRHPEHLAAALLQMKHHLHWLGSDRGGMTVTLVGTGPNGREQRVVWSLVAERGDGPNIPAIPSVLIARKLLAGTIAQRGAMPAVGLFSLEEFRAAVADLAITDCESTP